MMQSDAAGSTAVAAPGPRKGSRWLPLVLQPQLRQSLTRADKRPLVLQPQLCQAPIGRTECLWFYGVEPLVLHRARPLGGQTTTTGSTAAAVPGPDRGSRRRKDLMVKFKI
jgi:hypothetical protein